MPKHALGPNDSEIEGAKSAPVLVQEYADFQCPSCKVFHDRVGATVNDLVREKKIRFAYTFFPFLGDESVRAASAAICAGDQDTFFPYADLLYTNQAAENSGFLTADQLVVFGDEAGITGSAFDTFERCVRDGTYEGFARPAGRERVEAWRELDPHGLRDRAEREDGPAVRSPDPHPGAVRAGGGRRRSREHLAPPWTPPATRPGTNPRLASPRCWDCPKRTSHWTRARSSSPPMHTPA